MADPPTPGSKPTLLAKLCLPTTAANGLATNTAQSYANVVRSGTIAAVLNVSGLMGNPLGGTPQSLLEIQPSGGGAVPSVRGKAAGNRPTGVCSPMGTVSSTQQPSPQAQHYSPPAPATNSTSQFQGSIPQATRARAASTRPPPKTAHQQQYHNLADPQQLQMQQAQIQGADLEIIEHQVPNHSRPLPQIPHGNGTKQGRVNALDQSNSPQRHAQPTVYAEALQATLKQPTSRPPSTTAVHRGDSTTHSIVGPQNIIRSKLLMHGNVHLLRRPLPYAKVRPSTTVRDPGYSKTKPKVAAEMRAHFQQRQDGPRAMPQHTAQARHPPRQSTQIPARHGAIKNGIFTPSEEQPLVSEPMNNPLAPHTLSGGIPQVHGNASSTQARTQGNNIVVQQNSPKFPPWLPSANRAPITVPTQEHVHEPAQRRGQGTSQHEATAPQCNTQQAMTPQPQVSANSSKASAHIDLQILKLAQYRPEGPTPQVPQRPEAHNANFQSENPYIQPGGRGSVMGSSAAANSSMEPHRDQRPLQSVQGVVHQAAAQQTPLHPEPSIRRVHASQQNPRLAQGGLRPQPLRDGTPQTSAVHPMQEPRAGLVDSADRSHEPPQQQNKHPANSSGSPRQSQARNGMLPPPLMFPKGPKSNLVAQLRPDRLRMPPPSGPRRIPTTYPPSPFDAFVFPRICRVDDVQIQPSKFNSSYPLTSRIMGKLGSKVLQDLEERPLMRENQKDRPKLFTCHAQLATTRGQNPAMIQGMKVAGADAPKITPPSWMGPPQTPDRNAQVTPPSRPTPQITQTPHSCSTMSKMASPRKVMNPQPGNSAGQPTPQTQPTRVMARPKTTPAQREPVHSTPIGQTSLVNSRQNPSPHPQSTTSGMVASKSPHYLQVPTPSTPGITTTPAVIYTHPFEQSYVKDVSAALRSEQCNMTRLNIMADAILSFEKLQSMNPWLVREQRLQQFRSEYIKSLDKFTMLLQPTIQADETAKNAREAEVRQFEAEAKRREKDAKRPVEERLLETFSAIDMDNLQPVRQGPYWVGPGTSPELWQKQEHVFQRMKEQDRKARRKHVGAGQVLGDDEDPVALFVEPVKGPVGSRLFDPCWGRSQECKCDAAAAVVEAKPNKDAGVRDGMANDGEENRVQVKGKRKAEGTMERRGPKRSCDRADLYGGYGKRQIERPPLKKSRGQEAEGRPKRKAADTPDRAEPKRARVSKKKG